LSSPVLSWPTSGCGLNLSDTMQYLKKLAKRAKTFLDRVGWIHVAGLLLAAASGVAVEKGLPHAGWLVMAAALFTRLDKLIVDGK
jgi:hypothetical protein